MDFASMPVVTSYRRMVLSARPAATYLPSGLKATLLITAGAVNFLTTAALAAVHTVNDLSAPPAATLAPLALKATAVTARVLPGKALSICWLARFQRRACLSVHPVSSLV